MLQHSKSRPVLLASCQAYPAAVSNSRSGHCWGISIVRLVIINESSSMNIIPTTVEGIQTVDHAAVVTIITNFIKGTQAINQS